MIAAAATAHEGIRNRRLRGFRRSFFKLSILYPWYSCYPRSNSLFDSRLRIADCRNQKTADYTDFADPRETLNRRQRRKESSFGRTSNLRFLSLLLFMISEPSVLSAVTPSVGAEPRWVIGGQIPPAERRLTNTSGAQRALQFSASA